MNGIPQIRWFGTISTSQIPKLWKIMAVVLACCAVAAVLLFANSRARRTMSLSQSSSISAVTSHGRTFRLTKIFEGSTEDGERYVNSFCKISDCISLSKVVIFFNSAEGARRELKLEEAKASRLVDRTVVTSSEGRPIGERIVLEFEAYAEVAWTTNKDFHSISATSLENVLEFEHALNNQKGKITTQLGRIEEVTFTGTEITHGKSGDFDYTEQQFRSSDCETVIVRVEVFTSSEHAEEALLRRLKDATMIIQRGPRPNTTALQKGRVVAMVTAPPDSEQLEDTMVLWTNNAELHSIRGTMVHALEFERRNFR